MDDAVPTETFPVYSASNAVDLGKRTSATCILSVNSCIDSGAFYGCDTIVSVSISCNVPESAFSGCLFLEQVRILSPAMFVGERAFYGCGKLKDVYMHDSVEAVGSEAFRHCTSIKAVSFAGELGENVYAGCTSLATARVARTTRGLFEGCTALRSVVLSDDATCIEPYAFYGCSSLVEMNYKCETVEPIICMPPGVTRICAFAFAGCYAITGIDMDNVTALDETAFAGCVLGPELHGMDI